MSGPWQQLTDLSVQAVPAWTAAGAAVLAAAAVAALVLAALRRSRPARTGRGRRLETVLTVAAAGIATGVSASGMWRVFGDALDMSGPARVGVFGFVELAVAVSAIRARRALRETGSTGVDGAAVWVLAGLSAVLSALDAHNATEVLLRLAAPLVAAWLWERGLAPDRRAGQIRRQRGPVAWRVTRERVLVWLRLAEPTERAVAEVDRARKIARLTRAAWRYHSLTAADAAGWRIRRAAAALRRHTLTGVEHLALGQDDQARDAVRRSLATLYQVTAGTAPDALAHLAPWADPPAHPDADRATPKAAGPASELDAPGAASSAPADVAPAALGASASDHLERLNGRSTTGVQSFSDGPYSVQAVQSVSGSDPARPPAEADSRPSIERPGRSGLNALTARSVDLDGVQSPTSRPLNPGAGVLLAAQPPTRPAPPALSSDWPGTPPEVDSAAARAGWVAQRYHEAHGALPTASELTKLTNVSRGTAGTVLKALRDAPTTPSSTNNDHDQTSPPADDSDQTKQHHEPEADQHQTHDEDHQTHHTSKIQKSYTPRHHDPEEDQLRDADAPAGTTADGPQGPSEGAGPAVRPAGDPVGVS